MSSPQNAFFHWDDPLLLDAQLTDEEPMVRESARAYSECDPKACGA